MCTLPTEMVLKKICCNILGLQQRNEICEDFYWEMATVFVYLFLPLAGLTILWKRREIFVKFWSNVQQYHLPVIFKSFGKQNFILQWAKGRLPPRWSSYMETLSGGISDFWNDGSLLCTLINTAVPGACPNTYRHWHKTPAHAQDVAYKYLGIFPIFSDSELTSPLTSQIEQKLLKYLVLIQKSICKLEKDKLLYNYISTKFTARGMGLYTGEQFKESEFYVYSKIENASFCNVEIFILGPFSTYCRTTVKEMLVRENKNTKGNSKSWLKAKESYLDKLKNLNESIDVENNIEIKVQLEHQRVRVIYISKNYGIHEVNLSCNKEAIMGSPFYVNILKSSCSSEEKGNGRIINNLATNTKAKEHVIKSIVDNPKQEDSLLNICNMLDKGNGQNNKDKNQTWNEKREIKFHVENNKFFDKTASGPTKLENYKNADDSFKDVNLSKVNNYTLNKESTLEISKYLKDLSSLPQKDLNSNFNTNNSTDHTQDTPNSFYFIKENYSSFQRTVDSSFRKSCRITRYSPRLVERKFPVVSSASPLCSDHIVPEDFRKLSVAERRKKFSLQKSSVLDSGKERTSSSFSIEENNKEPASNKEKLKNIDTNLSEEVSSSTKINQNNFNKFIDVDPVNKYKESTRFNKLVKQRKMFWETAFHNSNKNAAAKHVKTEDNIKNEPAVGIKENIFKTEDKCTDKDLSTIKTISKNEIIEDGKLSLSHVLKHVDSLSLLKRSSFTKSSNDVRYSERRRSLITYKSLDDNLEKCCNISLDNRTQIYLKHVESFKSNSKENYQPSGVKFTVNKPGEGSELKPTDNGFKQSKPSPSTMIVTSGCAANKNNGNKPLKITFKKAFCYFRSLENIFNQITSNNVTKCANSGVMFSSNNFESKFKLNKKCAKFNDTDTNKTHSENKRSNAIYRRGNILSLGSTKNKSDEIGNISSFKYRKGKNIASLFDVLY